MLYYPMKPREWICEWQLSDTTDTDRSHVSNNTVDVKLPNCIRTILIHTIQNIVFNSCEASFKPTVILTREYANSDAA